MLIVWGKNDQIFPAAGAEPYKRDLKTLEFHLLDAGHFALESNGDEIARLMHEFLGKHVTKSKPAREGPREPIEGLRSASCRRVRRNACPQRNALRLESIRATSPLRRP